MNPPAPELGGFVPVIVDAATGDWKGTPDRCVQRHTLSRRALAPAQILSCFARRVGIPVRAYARHEAAILVHSNCEQGLKERAP